MADWDADGPRLSNNLKAVLQTVRDQARRRIPVQLAHARGWHRVMMHGLHVPGPQYVGQFRGEAGLQRIGVRIGDAQGVHPDRVAAELLAFEHRLNIILKHLDAQIPAGSIPGPGLLDEVLAACAWAHAEWVRIHPFANGNGRTARIWANLIAMRYGLPPFVQLRPRPRDHGYAAAAAKAMKGDQKSTAVVFRAMLEAYLDDNT